MTPRPLLTATAMLALGACAGHAETRPLALRPGYAAAVRVDPPPPQGTARAAQLAAAVSAAGAQVRPQARTRRVRPGRARGRTVEDANRSATREPSSQAYVGAAQVYAWSEGALYRLYATPERVSDIALQAGETLISVAAGDTARWVIGDTTSGSGAGRRTHILVKPSAAALRTNMVITTDRRVYHVELESRAGDGMASISWTYPQGALLALEHGGDATGGSEPVGQGIAIEALNFAYRIEGGHPRWRPLRAFDDGTQVYIEFPPGLAATEAPPLFVTGVSGGAELVNYRLRGRYYVVDRLFEAAELRLGERRQEIVRIMRELRGRVPRRGNAS